MKILICGFMGAGKTSLINKITKNNQQVKGFDLDELVASSLGISANSLGEWINQNGLDNFRILELRELKKVIKDQESFVLALGGGTPTILEFWDVIKSCRLVFLDVGFETCYQRVSGDTNRPLAMKSKEELLDLYKERVRLYKRAELHLDQDQIKEIVGLESLVHNFLDC